MSFVRFRAALAAAPALALTLLVAAVGPLPAQGAGSGATTILRVAPGPVPLSLGNAFSAVRAPLAVEYNPAGLSGPEGLGVSYQALPVEASAGAAVLMLPVGRVSLGASLRFLDYGDVDVVERGQDPVGRPTGGTAGGGEVSALAGAAMAVGPARFGLAGRWLRQDIAGLTDNAVALDAGMLLALPWGLDLGMAVQHLGPELEAGRPAPLPRTVRLGAAVRRDVLGMGLLVTAEAREREERLGGGFGVELAREWRDDVEAALRLGYETRPNSGDAFSPLVVGGGVRLGSLGVDIAWRSLGPLGTTRQLGLSYRF